MKTKRGPGKMRLFVMYVAFGVAVTFAATILFFWIFQEVASPIPMSILIGALVGAAFMVFSNRIAAEHKLKHPPKKVHPPETAQKRQEEVASTDEK